MHPFCFLVFLSSLATCLSQIGPPASFGVCGTTIQTRNISYSIVTDDANGTVTGFPGGYRQIVTDGCPGYDWTSQSTPNQAKRLNITVKLPLQPKITKVKTYLGIKKEDGTSITSPLLGPVGISINGVSIYGNSDAELRDAFVFESPSFDKCGGHPQGFGQYHYHEEPNTGCVFNDTAGQHSPLFGFMYDGIPIFGQLGDNGTAPTDLDECGGHVDKTYPFYHYHLPKNKTFPYTLTCLKGCILGSNDNPFLGIQYTINMANCNSISISTQYNYSSINQPDLIKNSTPVYPANTSSSQVILFSAVALIISSLIVI